MAVLKRIVVLATEEEFDRIKNMAGLIPVSRWIKIMLLGGKLSATERAQVNAVIPDSSPERENSASRNGKENHAKTPGRNNRGVRVEGRSSDLSERASGPATSDDDAERAGVGKVRAGNERKPCAKHGLMFCKECPK